MPLAQRRTDQRFEHARHRGGIARQAEEEAAFRSAERLRTAGLHRHPPERDAFECRQAELHGIERSRGYAADGDRHIGARQRARDRFADARGIVTGALARDQLGAAFFQQGAEHGPVAVVDRSGAQRLSRGEQLVSGGDHGHARPAPDEHGWLAQRSEQPEVVRGELTSGFP